MVIPGETGHAGKACQGCCELLELKVCQSAAGYYLGTWCLCGPFSRESGYYPSEKAAQDALDNFDVSWR